MKRKYDEVMNDELIFITGVQLEVSLMFEGSLVKKGKLCVLLLSMHVLFTMLKPWKRLCLKLQRLLSHVATDYFFCPKKSYEWT